MKLHRSLAALGIALLALALTHCSNEVGRGSQDLSNLGHGSTDNGLRMGGKNECDPDDEVSFDQCIQPIFDNRCTNCHRPPTPPGRLDLTPGNSFNNLVNQPTSAGCMAEVPGSILVRQCDDPPCDPSQSMLWAKTLPDARPPDGRRCRAPMPFGTEGLGVIAPDEFALIEAWIVQGAEPDK
jgi:hypothetical protein